MRRSTVILLGILLWSVVLWSGVVVAQVGEPAVALQSYVVQLTELRLTESCEPGLSASEVMRSVEQLRKDGKVDLLETVRLSALEGQESMVQFGKTMAVTTAVQVSEGRTARGTQSRTVGTLVRVTARPEGEAILLTLEYEASRFDGAGQEDTPPDTGTVRATTTLSLKPGEPTLVGGFRSEKTTLLIVSIDE